MAPEVRIPSSPFLRSGSEYRFIGAVYYWAGTQYAYYNIQMIGLQTYKY